MTCAEFRELAALFAAGGLDPAERAAVEEHLREPRHEGCFEELRRAGAGVEVLARSLVPARPDDAVWGRIQSQLGAESPWRMGWRERAAWGIAAAAALLLFASLSTLRQERRHAARRGADLAAAATDAESKKRECIQQLASLRVEGEEQRKALDLLQSPTAQVVSLAPQPGKPAYSARVLVDLPQKKAMVLSSALPPQAGKDFELWVIRGEEAPAPAGLLRAGPSGTVLASIDPRLLALAPDALAVSVEPQGGSPTGKPSGDIVLVGAMPKT